MKKLIEKIKHFKSELVVIPLLFAFVWFAKGLIASLAPEAAQFNFFEETETLLFKMSEWLLISTAVFGFIRVMFPAVAGSLYKQLFEEFEEFPAVTRLKFGLWIWTVVLIAFMILLTSCTVSAADRKQEYEHDLRMDLLDALNGQMDVREATGKNDGKAVGAYLASVGLGERYPWCAAYVSYNLQAFDIDNPNSAWSPHFAKKKDIIWSPKKGGKEPKAGDVFTIWYTNLDRVGHVGFIESQKGGHFVTIEGNTNEAGSRLGIGVFKRKRDARKIYAVTDYITKHVQKIFDADDHNGCHLDHDGRVQAQREECDENGARERGDIGNAGDCATGYDIPKTGHGTHRVYTGNGGLKFQHPTRTCGAKRNDSQCESGDYQWPTVSGVYLRFAGNSEPAQYKNYGEHEARHEQAGADADENHFSSAAMVLVGDGNWNDFAFGLDTLGFVQIEINI